MKINKLNYFYIKHVKRIELMVNFSIFPPINGSSVPLLSSKSSLRLKEEMEDKKTNA